MRLNRLQAVRVNTLLLGYFIASPRYLIAYLLLSYLKVIQREMNQDFPRSFAERGGEQEESKQLLRQR